MPSSLHLSGSHHQDIHLLLWGPSALLEARFLIALTDDLAQVNCFHTFSFEDRQYFFKGGPPSLYRADLSCFRTT